VCGAASSRAIHFEQHVGAACAPLAPRYRPRAPQASVLHQVVREHLQTMLAEAALRHEDNRGYPRFVEREFRRYLECGSLGRGFARLRCRACGHERLLSFSCKGRLCPSCQARRMHDVAFHLSEQVIPAVPLRQWVFTVPRALRFPLHRDGPLRRALVSILCRTIFMLQRRQARAVGFPRVKPGAVTFLHEGGSALNLNPHAHSLIPDGVFVVEPEQPPLFVELPPPTLSELEAVLATIVRRVERAQHRAARHSARERCAALELEDPLAVAQAQAVDLRLESPSRAAESPASSPPPLCAVRQGFSLHAAVTVAATDTEGRLRVLRYGARPVFSSQHLSLLPDGRVRYALRRPAGRALVLEPTELLHRLAALLPRPHQRRTVYHGIFSPAAHGRDEISPAAARVRREAQRASGVALAARCAAEPHLDPDPDPDPAANSRRSAAGRRYTLEAGPAHPSHTSSTTAVDSRPDAGAAARAGADAGAEADAEALSDRDAEAQATARCCAPPPRPPGGRFPWAELIRRTYPDALDCPRCGGTLSVIAFITEAAVVQKILHHLGLPSSSPEPAPARLPRELRFDFDSDSDSELVDLPREGDDHGPAAAAVAARGPPQLDHRPD